VLDDRVQRGGGADVGDDEDRLSERAPQDAGVLSGAGDVVAVEQRRVEPDLRRDRGHLGDDEEPPEMVAARRVRDRPSVDGAGVLGGAHGCLLVGRLGLSRGWMWVGRVDGLRSSGLAWVTESSGSPRSRSLCSSPCSAVWSARASQDGGAVGGVGEVEVVEPRGPAVVEPALDADLVPVAVVPVRCSAHGPQAKERG